MFVYSKKFIIKKYSLVNLMTLIYTILILSTYLVEVKNVFSEMEGVMPCMPSRCKS